MTGPSILHSFVQFLSFNVVVMTQHLQNSLNTFSSDTMLAKAVSALSI